MGEEQKTKDQHYVPRSYLSRFGNADGKVWVFDKKTRKSFASSPEKIAHEKYFYDIDESLITTEDQRIGNKKQLAEKALSQIEGDYNSTLNVLLGEGEKDGIKPELKAKIAFFMTIQFLRTREARTQVVQVFDGMLKALGDEFPDLPAEEKHVRLAPQSHSLLHLKHLFNPELWDVISHTLMQHIWIFGVNSSAQTLYTSDHPLARRAHISHPILSNNGLGSPGIEIAFPLTPRHILILMDRQVFADERDKDLAVFMLTEDHATYYNSLQVRDSYRFVFSQNGDFELANKICDEHPTFGNPDRVRVEINPGRKS